MHKRTPMTHRVLSNLQAAPTRQQGWLMQWCWSRTVFIRVQGEEAHMGGLGVGRGGRQRHGPRTRTRLHL